MYFRKPLLCIVCIIAACNVLRAEVLKGRIVDAETREPLGGAKVEIQDVIPDFCTSMCTLTADSAGYFHYGTQVGNILTITGKYFGYNDKSIKRIGIGGNDTIYLDDIALKPSAVLMKELMVDAKVKRFYVKGDTVVFNPQAFNMESGDRLIKLVEKLPGVSVKDGKLLWNGEPLKVMMNGKDALSQDMMLNLLPVEAVDKIKAYDRTSELQDRTGVADGNQEHVLDVAVKPGFMEKFLTEAEAKAYAGKQYAAQLNAMKLSDSNPIMIFGRVADDPMKTSLMTMGAKGWSSGIMPVRQQMGALAYRHQWRPDSTAYRDSRWDITAGINHTDENNEKWEERQVFMPETTPTMSKSDSRDYRHNLTVPIDFSSFLNLGAKNTLWLNANLSYVRDLTKNNMEQETAEAEDWLTRVNASEYRSRTETETFKVSGEGTLTHYFRGGSLAANAGVSYANAEAKGSSRAEYRYFQSGETTIDTQRFSAPDHNLAVNWRVDLNKTIGKDIMTHAQWHTSYEHKYRDEQRWRNDAPDMENSTYRKDNIWRNTLMLDANVKVGHLTIKPSLELKHHHEQTSYRRAALDTLATRNMLLTRPMLEMHYRFKGQMGLKGTLSYSNTPADMIDCIGYVDDTNPLYILMGNPALKTSHTLNATLLYTLMLTRHCQSLSVTADYSKTYDPIGTVMHYNSQTGAYRVQKQNVRGGDRWSMKVAYERDLIDGLTLSNTIRGTYYRSFGIMTLVDDATGLTYNRQSETILRDELGLTYKHGPWHAEMNHKFSWKHYAYSDAGLLESDLFKYHLALQGSYKLKQWKFLLDPSYILDRGYTSRYMNGGQFLLNARINFQFIKNRADLELRAYDLLNQKKWYEQSITATSHSESWEKSLGRYVTLTFRYRFDPKADKKQAK